MLGKADQEVFEANTMKLFGLQKTIDEQMIKIASLHEEKDARNNSQALDTKLNKEAKHRA